VGHRVVHGGAVSLIQYMLMKKKKKITQLSSWHRSQSSEGIHVASFTSAKQMAVF
jgi:acetate kinase